MSRVVRISLMFVLGLGCGSADEGSADAPGADAARPVVDAAAPVDAAPVFDAGTSLPELAACARGDGAVPDHVADVVAHINGLPEPLSVACLVASLPRPLSLVASISPSSLQPARGRLSPRIFILYPGLTLSVVPTGDGKDRLEFGEWVTPERTLKGELHFPLERPVSDAAPYEGLLMQSQTISDCGFCHVGEERHESIPGAYVSAALRVFSPFERPVSELRALRASCDGPEPAGPQCLLLHALFDYGEVRQGAFSSTVMEGF